MTKEEIIKIIVIALIGSFSKSLFDNILGKYIPDKKKLNSYIKKSFLFTLRYISPIYFLIEAFLSNDPIDKKFVFIVSILTTVIFLNVLIDIFSFYYLKLKSHTAETLIAINKINGELHITDKGKQFITKQGFVHTDKILKQEDEIRNKTIEKFRYDKISFWFSIIAIIIAGISLVMTLI
jgi:hypothetical protein